MTREQRFNRFERIVGEWAGWVGCDFAEAERVLLDALRKSGPIAQRFVEEWEARER